MKKTSLVLMMVLALGAIENARGGLRTLPQGQPEFVPSDVLVKFKENTGSQGRGGIISRYHLALRHTFRQISLYHFSIPPGADLQNALAKLRAEPGVLYAEPNYIKHALAVCNPP